MKSSQTIKNKLVVVLILTTFVLGFNSCKDDESMDLPEITGVRKIDPELADSTFTRSFPNEMIVIVGKNLSGLRNIYCNDYEVIYNPNYVTDTHIIITIPAETPLKGANPDMPNQIRLETNHGECVYDFQFLSSPAEIFVLNYDMPISVGSEMTVIGQNFYEIDSVVIYNDYGSILISDYSVNADYSEIKFDIPDGGQFDGSVAVYCVTNTVSDLFLSNPIPEITGFSNDYPIVGEQVTIYGRYLINIKEIILNDQIVIPGDEVTTNRLRTEAYFTMPDSLTQGGRITVKCQPGTVYSDPNFYFKEYVIANFDDVAWFLWGSETDSVRADGTEPPYVSNGKCQRIFGNPSAWNYWYGNLATTVHWPGFDTIPENTLLDNLVLRFNFFSTYPLDVGYFQTQIGGRWTDEVPAAINYEWYPYMDSEGNTIEMSVEKWVSYDISLSEYGADLVTYGDVKALDEQIGFFFKNASEKGDLMIDFYFDDFRIIDITK